jgi:hypothetical protein
MVDLVLLFKRRLERRFAALQIRKPGDHRRRTVGSDSLAARNEQQGNRERNPPASWECGMHGASPY